MAYGSFANVLTAVREVLDDGTGSLRTITAGRFTDDLDPSVDEAERQRRGIRADKPFRVRITGMRRHPASPGIYSSTILYEIDVEVTISRTVATLEQISSDDFSVLQALGWEDADAIRQALCTPPNLESTSASAATNLAGDSLIYKDSRGLVVPIQGDGAGRYETIHRLTGILKVLPATS